MEEFQSLLKDFKLDASPNLTITVNYHKASQQFREEQRTTPSQTSLISGLVSPVFKILSFLQNAIIFITLFAIFLLLINCQVLFDGFPIDEVLKKDYWILIWEWSKKVRLSFFFLHILRIYDSKNVKLFTQTLDF